MPNTLLPSISIRGLAYQSGLDAIRLAAVTAEASLNAELACKRLELDAYDARPGFIGEREDGHILWELDQVLEMDIARLEEALPELRRAFALSAYHYWETAVYRWHHQEHGNAAKKRLGPHDDLVEEIRRLAQNAPDLSFRVHPDLEAVAKLANVIKHTSADSWQWLIRQCPEPLKPLFPAPPAPSDRHTPVMLTVAQLAWVFEVVSQSGPAGYPGGAGAPRTTDAQ